MVMPSTSPLTLGGAPETVQRFSAVLYYGKMAGYLNLVSYTQWVTQEVWRTLTHLKVRVSRAGLEELESVYWYLGVETDRWMMGGWISRCGREWVGGWWMTADVSMDMGAGE